MSRCTTYHGNNRRGALTIPEHAHPLVRQFVAAINEQQTTLAEIAERGGLSVDTLRFWRSRHVPRLDTFIAALNVLDLELVIRRKQGDA